MTTEGHVRFHPVTQHVGQEVAQRALLEVVEVQKGRGLTDGTAQQGLYFLDLFLDGLYYLGIGLRRIDGHQMAGPALDSSGRAV